jgi:SWI/SNF-related matrix-associated actin-dependent regulator of chromatin subfamily A-like protein 1
MTGLKLFDYQQEGVEFLASRRRGYLADDMGLGKTAQAIRAAVRGGSRRTLVIAPASAIPNWYAEWKLWGNGAVFGAMSYDRLVRSDTVKGGDWDVVILDEAHYVKTRGAKRTLAALTVARDAPRAMLLSGSPMPNHPGELWAPLRALWGEIPSELGIRCYSEWLDVFTRWQQTIYGPKVWSAKNLGLLRPHLQRVMLRRRLEEVGLQLPPLRIDAHLLPKDRTFDEALERAGMDADQLGEAMEGESGEDGSLSRLRRYVGEYKAPRVAELITDELAHRAYSKIVVLAHHHSVLEILRDRLAPFGVVGFDGTTPIPQRQVAIEDFRTGSARVFVAQQSAAGIAINLQVASEIVLVEPPWSPDELLQAVKRIHRIGSTEPCRARLFGVADTLDEGMTATRVRKARMAVELGFQGG